MKYVIVSDEGKLVRRRIFPVDPATLPAESLSVASGTVYEISDAEGDTIAGQMQALEPGENLLFDSGTNTASVIRAIDNNPHLEFVQIVNLLLKPRGNGARAKLHEILAPSLAFRDWAAMYHTLNNTDVSGFPADVQQLKADVLLAIGREMSRAEGFA